MCHDVLSFSIICDRLGSCNQLLLPEAAARSSFTSAQLLCLTVHVQFAWRRPCQQTGQIVNNGGAIVPQETFRGGLPFHGVEKPPWQQVL